VRELRRATGARCAWIIGHSEGGLVALLAGDADPGICGAILVAAPGRPLGQLLREQLAANPANGPLLGQAFAALAALEAGQHVDGSALDPRLLPLFRPSVQDFLIGALAVDPAQAIAGYRKPVLVLQGERDLQVAVEDARRLARAAPDGELVLVPDANHVLKRVASDDRAANIATYGDPGLPLADGFVEAIAAFVARH
jgi:pimeloyl-ACP methyl ester carboxylesterase